MREPSGKREGTLLYEHRQTVRRAQTTRSTAVDPGRLTSTICQIDAGGARSDRGRSHGHGLIRQSDRRGIHHEVGCVECVAV